MIINSSHYIFMFYNIEKKNNIAMPQQVITATKSSIVVINGPDATAGSIFSFFNKQGILTPTKLARVSDTTIAINTLDDKKTISCITFPLLLIN